jgi:hypothetical protein
MMTDKPLEFEPDSDEPIKDLPDSVFESIEDASDEPILGDD